MIKLLKTYRWFAGVLLINLIVALIAPATARASIINSTNFLWQILLIVPSIMVLMGLFDVWVPRKTVEGNIGSRTGLRGAAMAMLLATAAAGPLYAAFPVALSLQRKGARLANISIFLGTWAAIKIPMILLESSFIGFRFSMLRLVLTIPGVLGIGFLMEWMLPATPNEASPLTAEVDVLARSQSANGPVLP